MRQKHYSAGLSTGNILEDSIITTSYRVSEKETNLLQEERMKKEPQKPIEMTGAKILAESLLDLGVEHVFGYTGAAMLPVMDELGQSGIRIIVNSNEQSAAFSAAGYSRSGDKVGIAIVTHTGLVSR